MKSPHQEPPIPQISGLLLAIETASTNCSLALYKGRELLGEHTLYVRNKHDELLAYNAQALLEQCGFSVQHLDAIAVSSGPGSFTGLRIGAAFAKGLCLGTPIKLAPVSTLAAVATAAKHCLHPTHDNILVVIPSHRDLAYMQSFDRKGVAREQGRLATISEINACVQEGTLVCGPGATLLETYSGVLISGLNRLTARFVGLLGAELLEQNSVIAAADFVPTYMQEFEVRTN